MNAAPKRSSPKRNVVQRAKRGATTRQRASAFVPHPWLRNRHVQTLLPLLRADPEASFEIRSLTTADDDFVNVGWTGPDAPDAPVAVLVHGLSGSLRSPYVVGMARRLAGEGWRVAAFQLRGAGQTPNRSIRGYHHADTEDLRSFCHSIREERRSACIALVGWSLGASVVLRAMGEEGPGAPVDGAVAVSCPVDLTSAARHLEQVATIYQFAMLRALKRALRRKHEVVAVGSGIDLDAALSSQTFSRFGDAYLAPCNGFTDSRDYCHRASCKPFLRHIRRPALILHAADDPVLGPTSVPDIECLSDSTILEVSDSGGHAGFVSLGENGGLRFWLEDRIADYLGVIREHRRR